MDGDLTLAMSVGRRCGSPIDLDVSLSRPDSALDVYMLASMLVPGLGLAWWLSLSGWVGAGRRAFSLNYIF